jgi:hypothetical protein
MLRALVLVGLGAAVLPGTAHAAAPSLRVQDISITEANAAGVVAQVPITLSKKSTTPVKVGFTTRDGTAKAPGDYAAKSGTVTFPAGVTKKFVPVQIAGDLLDENNERFSLKIVNPTGATIADGVGVVTIVDNDPLPALTANNAQKVEPNAGATTKLQFPIQLSPVSGRVVTVSYTVTQGSATAGVDYTPPTTSTVRFPAGATVKKVPITVIGDNLDEVDETFQLTLISPVNANIAGASAIGTIVDNDGPAISINNSSRNEGWSGTPSNNLTFNITLSASSPQEVRVNWTTANGTAVAPSDYLARSGTETFAPGQTLKQITVPIVGDLVVEPNETVFVDLSAPVNATIASSRGTGTIVNDDCASTDEGRTNATFLGGMSGDTGGTVFNRNDSICTGDVDWYRVRLTENHFDPFFDRYLSAKIELFPSTSPAQTSGDLDLQVYRSNGTLVSTSTQGGTATETLFVKKADSFATDDVDVFIRVYPFGTSVNNYQLRVTGNVVTGIAPNL